jgi:hypothetical protein
MGPPSDDRSSAAHRDPRVGAPVKIPAPVYERVSSLCRALPEVTARADEPRISARSTAWSYDIRRRSFCLLVAVRPQNAEPAPRLALRVDPQDREALGSLGHPHFCPQAGHRHRDPIAARLTDATDWEEIRELVTESYRLLAPKKLSATIASWSQWSGADAATHHPAPLGDPAVTGEAQLLEQVLRAGMEVGPTLRLAAIDLLGVGLYEATTGRSDCRQCASNSDSGNPVATMTLPGEDAADPPVRELDELLVVGLDVVDRRELIRGAVLAPAHAGRTVVDENLVNRPLSRVAMFVIAVMPGAGSIKPLGVKAHAPAAAPYAVVRLDQVDEVVPGLCSEQTSRVGLLRRPLEHGLHRLTVRRSSPSPARPRTRRLRLLQSRRRERLAGGGERKGDCSSRFAGFLS